MKNKTKLISVICVLVLVVGVFAFMSLGTGAWFSDQEKSNGNNFAAGKLDLQLDGIANVPFNVVNVVPGQSGRSIISLTNTAGSIPGKLNINLFNQTGSENGLTDAEVKAGDYENGGDLQLFLQFAAFIDVNKDGTFNEGDIQLTYDGQQKVYPGFWNGDFHFAPLSGMMNGGWNNIITLPGGSSVNLIMMWQFPGEQQDANYNQNLAMTDSLGFDVNFLLNQDH